MVLHDAAERPLFSAVAPGEGEERASERCAAAPMVRDASPSYRCPRVEGLERSSLKVNDPAESGVFSEESPSAAAAAAVLPLPLARN